MFLLDTLMINGISWALKTAVTAAEAEMNDDTALREQLLAAEMQREMGEITDDDFVKIERDLLARIREIKERREGGSGPLAFGEGEPIETGGDGRLQIEASVSGDFHESGDAPHTTVVEEAAPRRGLIGTRSGQTERILDVEPLRAETLPARRNSGRAKSRSKARPRRRSSALKTSGDKPGLPRRSSARKTSRAKAGKIR
jgi:hypothetical protein